MIECICCKKLTNEEDAEDNWHYVKDGKFICPKCYKEIENEN